MNWLQKVSQQKLLIIARGPSGSGKSTMVEKIRERYDAPVFSTDDFWMQGGQYNFDMDYIDYAHFWNKTRVEEAMQGEVPVIIVDNTNTRFWEMKPYVEMAQKYGYDVEFSEPDWHPDLKTPEGKWSVDFLEGMQSKGNRPEIGKVVPRSSLERMVDQYDYNPTVQRILESER